VTSPYRVDGDAREPGLTLGKRRLTIFDQIKVASPCPARWTDMSGDDRVRFCASCDRSVYDLSVLSREAAQRFLEERASEEPCVRFFRRSDGTILTSDCPVGVRRERRKQLTVAATLAGVGMLALAGATFLLRGTGFGSGTFVQGKIAAPAAPAVASASTTTSSR
jgi:hypothetical protein